VTDTTVTGGGNYISLGGGSFPTGSVNLGADLPYVISGEITIPAGAEVTVGPGQNVKFANARLFNGQLQVNGTLIANGSTTAPAVFSSEFDDSAGGHCSCATVGQAPTTGDWTGITVASGATVSLDNAAIRYSAEGVALQGSGATLNIVNSVLSDNASEGVQSNAANAISVASSTFAANGTGIQVNCSSCTYAPTITNDSFKSEAAGVQALGQATPIVAGSRFTSVVTPVSLASTAAATQVSGSTVDGGGGFISLGGGSIAPGAVALTGDLPYVVVGQLTIPVGSTLSVGAGENVKFMNANLFNGDLQVNGTLNATGTPAAPAVFSSKFDDSAGGHCSCATVGQAPSTGDWTGIMVASGATVSLIDAAVRYAGSGISLQGSAATLTVAGSTISNTTVGLQSNSPNSVASATNVVPVIIATLERRPGRARCRRRRSATAGRSR
jgi:hypothetical protein